MFKRLKIWKLKGWIWSVRTALLNFDKKKNIKYLIKILKLN